MCILQADQLAKTFGRRRVVDGVSLHVQPGEIVGLLGPNGAGKTTTFRMICGLLKPESGTVTLAGKDVTDWPMFQRARSGGMGYLPQQSSIFAKLTVQQNLLAMMQLLKMDRKTQKNRCDELLAQFRIEKLRKSRAGKLSGGERRRLEIARCLVSNPEIIMLDEPFAGIDPVTVQNIQEIIEELRNTGISILITDHAAREILQITDRTYVVSEGRILCSGSAEEIVQHEEVKRKYLGEIEFTRSNGAPQSKPVGRLATVSSGEQGPEKNSEEPVVESTEEPGLEASQTSLPAAPILRINHPDELDIAAPAARDLPATNDDIETPEPSDEVVDKRQTGKRTRSKIRRPRITKLDAFENIKAPFSSSDIDERTPNS